MDGLNDVLAHEKNITLSDPRVIEILSANYALENPNLYNIKTQDCVSCHTSYHIRREIWSRLSKNEQALFDENIYPKSKNLISKFKDIYIQKSGVILTEYNVEKLVEKNPVLLFEMSKGGRDK